MNITRLIIKKGINIAEFYERLKLSRFSYFDYCCFYKRYSEQKLSEHEFEKLSRYFSK